MPDPADTPDYHRLRAIELRKAGRFDEALVHIQRALELRPDYPAGYYNLAAIRLEQGHADQAEQAWRRAIEIKPDYHQAWSGLSAALRRLGKHDEAIAAARQAVMLKADSADAHLALATSLFIARKFTEATAEFEQTLRLEPRNVLALNNYGNLLAEVDQPARAAQCYRAAIKLDPARVEVLNNLGNVLKTQAHVDAAIECFRKTLQARPDYWHIHSNLLLTLNCRIAAENGLLKEHVEWADRHANKFTPEVSGFPNDRSPDRRLRIGYVSADFRRHSVSYFIEPVLHHHDRSQFEIFCFSNVELVDDTTDRIRQSADRWRSIFGTTNDRAAQIIRDDRIDILIDLNGHTANHRLLVFARKPAPIQITYLGYPNTTGIAAMDYRLTDIESDPPGMTESHYTEKLIRLPAGAWCYRPAANAPDPRPLPAANPKTIVFGSFNSFAKVTEQTMILWAGLLREVPDSILLLKAECLGDELIRQEVRSRFAELDVDPTRIQLLGREPSFLKHLACYHRVDIALDTFPYNGTSTTCESMWMGVPVVTLAGRAHASRVGSSLLHWVGLDELIAQTPEQYISIAAELARDHARRRQISSSNLRLRMKTSALMDAPGFVRYLEAAYRQVWRDWCTPAA